MSHEQNPIQGQVVKIIPSYEIGPEGQFPVAIIKSGNEYHFKEVRQSNELMVDEIVDLSKSPEPPLI